MSKLSASNVRLRARAVRDVPVGCAEEVGAVGELEHDGGENDGTGDVIHAVLLEGHGAHADQDREDRGRTLHHTAMLRGRDVLRAENGDGDADRVIAVNAREDVRVGVGAVEPVDDPCEDVLRRVEDRAGRPSR